MLYISEDKKSGIFISPTRGLVEYNSVSDSFNEIESDDTRIEHDISSEVMTRLIMVLDEKTGLPVWFDIIPGNVLDINTVMPTINDVAVTLNIEIDSLVLDAGYISKEVISAFHIGTDKTIIGRMPARKGYPYKKLYCEVKDIISKRKYAFVRNRHAYFGYILKFLAKRNLLCVIGI